jgi:hypothetical protein
VAHGDDESLAEEDEDLSRLDDFFLGHVTGGLENQEDGIAVPLELRTLVGLDRVFYGELVKPELHPHHLELFLGRLVEPDPDERIFTSTGFEGALRGELTGEALPLPVDGAVDDHKARS